MNISIDQTSRIGPARVLRVSDGRVLVSVSDHHGVEVRAWALMALAYTYEPVEGDVLLVAGNADSFWVIGVVHGRGKTRLCAPGDLELSAPRGQVKIHAGEGVVVRGKDVTLAADTVHVRARSLVERLGSVLRKVRGKLSVHAASATMRCDGDYKLKADRIDAKARAAVDIDGDQIRLG